jgi:tetratricopeptide (TPR) repeat protein
MFDALKPSVPLSCDGGGLMNEPTPDDSLASEDQPVDHDSSLATCQGETVLRSDGALGDRADFDALTTVELVERLCDDQVRRWNAGQRVPAEAYLAQHPMLLNDNEAAFELIYGEYLLREQRGEFPPPEEFQWRFPNFASRLARQLELHSVLISESSAPTTIIEPNGCDATRARETCHTDDSLAPGYEIIGELGRGGMGVVYKAWQVSLKRVVALKVIRADAYAHPGAAARFHAEAEAAARFQHSNIVQVFEVGEHDGLGYLALEYVAGGGLDRKLSGSLQDPHYSARLTESLARAIHYAHQRGIVHRDLKPANVLLTEDGIPKITDFGLAKLLERDQGLTQDGELLGTPSYMAPEQVRGAPHQISPATDVYALGTILYEMLAGRPPFKGTTPLSTLEQVSSSEPLSPSKLQRHIPRDLETICLKCLAKEPRRRYASALDLADDLRRFLEHQPIEARPTPVWERAWKWARRRPGVATALLFTVSAIVLAAVVGVHYNARLRAALRAAQRAERAADMSAQAATEQRNLALNALKQLVFDVQERLGQTPATRSLRQSLLSTAIAGLEEIGHSAAGSAPDLNQAVAHQKLGDIFRIIGRSADARRHLERSRRFAEDLLAINPRDLAIAENLYQTYMGLGLLSINTDQHNEAKANLHHVVEIAEGMSANASYSGDKRPLIEAYFQLGRAYSFAYEYAAAEIWFRKMQDLAKRWVALDRANNQAKDLLASSYRKLGDLKKFAKEFAAARQDYSTAISISRQVANNDPSNATFRANLGVALDDLAGVARDQHQHAEARRLFQEAQQLFAEQAQADPENNEAQSRLFHTQFHLASLEEGESNFAQAAELFRTVLGEVSRLKRAGRLEDRRDPYANTRALTTEIAVCDAAPRALADLDFACSQPPPVAARLLLLKARTQANVRDVHGLTTIGDALLGLKPDTAEDLCDVARQLALFVTDLDSDRWPNLARPERQSLRARCADRAVEQLSLAVERGFRDRALFQSAELISLRPHPGYQSITARLKSPSP